MFDIIQAELFRNVLLCLAAVFFITLLLIAHPIAAFFVFLCVTFTLIDLLGFMYFWGYEISFSLHIYFSFIFVSHHHSLSLSVWQLIMLQ